MDGGLEGALPGPAVVAGALEQVIHPSGGMHVALVRVRLVVEAVVVILSSIRCDGDYIDAAGGACGCARSYCDDRVLWQRCHEVQFTVVHAPHSSQFNFFTVPLCGRKRLLSFFLFFLSMTNGKTTNMKGVGDEAEGGGEHRALSGIDRADRRTARRR